jgi:hypothetical protein
LSGKVDRVDYFGGATFATNENDPNSRTGSGISLGNYININNPGEIEGDFETYVIENPLYMHEYGHTFDSKIFGLSYLLAVGIPSLVSASGKGDHKEFWTETRANDHASRYFKKHYDVNWLDYINEYPL